MQLPNGVTIAHNGTRLLVDSGRRVSFQKKIRSARLCGILVFISLQVLAGPVLVLKGPNSPPYKEAFNGFRQAYPGGIDIDFGKTRELLARVRTDHPSVIVAIGRASAEAVHQQVTGIPLVFLMVAYPSQSGLSGSNVAGISMDVPGSVQLARFKEILPYPKKPIAVVYNAASSAPLVADAQKAAPGLELLLEQVPVESAEQVAMRLALVKPVIGAVWIVPDEGFVTKEGDKWFNDLLRETTALRLPLLMTMNASSTFVQKGALAAVVSDYFGMGRQCGELVKEIESGKTKVDTVGIQPPVAVSWQINLSTAQKINLALPQTVLNSAKTFH